MAFGIVPEVGALVEGGLTVDFRPEARKLPMNKAK